MSIDLAALQSNLALLQAAKMRPLTGALATTIETSTALGRSSMTRQAARLEDLNREIALVEAQIARMTGGRSVIRPMQVR